MNLMPETAPTDQLQRAAAQESLLSSEEWLLSQINVIGERDGLVEAMVPAHLIDHEEVPVNHDHVTQLAASMRSEAALRGGGGQIIPALVGHVPDQPLLKIMDGFHRDAAIMINAGPDPEEPPEIFCTIRLNCTMEDIWDFRILTATTQETVSFARVVEWIGKAWAATQWSEKISAVQAFSLTRTDSSGKILGLTANEVKGIKAWVQDKSDKWRMTASSIHTDLSTAEDADPELVKQVRPRESGRKLEQVTPLHLRIIAKALPDQYELQNIAARVAVENNLNAQQTRAVVEKLRTAPTIAEATAMAEETDWKAVDPVYSESRTRELRNKNATTGGADNAGSSASETSAQDAAPEISQFDMLGNVCRELLVTEATLGRTALSNLILEGEYLPPIAPDRTRLFDITPDNHEQLAVLVQPGNAFGKLDMFYDTTEKITEALMRRVTQSTKVTEDAARLALRLAVMRVATDLEQGDLRLAEITRPGIFSGLLYGCILDEIKRSRPAAALSTAMPDEAGLDGPEHSFRFADAVRAVPHMKPLVRRATTLHGLLGYSRQLSLRLAGGDPDHADRILSDGRLEIETAITRRARVLAEKERARARTA
jgi:hypothetical protein